jgi:hypothetical protein
MWTSPNHKALQAICVHFVDADTRKLCKALIGLPEHRGSHGGEEQAAAFWPIAEEFNIVGKIGYFTGDNHGSNDKMCRAISRKLEALNIQWNPVHHRIRCNGHVVNLAVQAFLFSKDKEAVDEAIREVEANKDLELEERLAERLKLAKAAGWRSIGPLGKLHNIAVHIRGSEARFNDFKDLAGRALGLDNDTRWNSWYLLLLTAIELRAAINQYAEKYYVEMKMITYRLLNGRHSKKRRRFCNLSTESH